MKNCEMCEIIFRTEDTKIIDKDGNEFLIKKNKHNTESSIKKGRCIDCEDIESRMSEICSKCGLCIYNQSVRYYRIYGNYCNRCMAIISNNLKKHG